MESSDIATPFANLDIGATFDSPVITATTEDPASPTSLRLEALTFDYELLLAPSEIRIVILEPGKNDEPVRCRLEHVLLDHEPAYEALSYAWGDATRPSQEIFLDGKRFEVTENLGAALLNLRDEAVEKPTAQRLWIDAICINQKDISERNSQVQKMKDIYSKAERVLIWLGRYHEPSDDSLDLNERIWGFPRLQPGTEKSIADIFQTIKELARKFPKFTPNYRYGRVIEEHATIPVLQWMELFRLLGRPWCHRLWVVQEVLLARDANVRCGRCEISWMDLGEVCLRIRKIAIMMGPGSRLGRILGELPDNAVIDPNFTNFSSRYPLLWLLWRFKDRISTDPRDRIYSLLGLCNDAEYIEVDYTKPAKQVYMDWAWAHIYGTGKLDLFSACVDSVWGGYPSWVPQTLDHDLHGVDISLFFSTFPWDGSSLYPAASGCSRCSPIKSEDGLHILIDGLYIDSIINILDEEKLVKILERPIRNLNKEYAQGPGADLHGTSLDIVKGFEDAIAKHFLLKELRYGTEKWAEFTEVLLRGMKDSRNWNLPTPDNVPTNSLHDRYATWRGFTPIPPEYEPHMTEDQRSGLYLLSLTSFIATLLDGMVILITKSDRIGVVTSGCDVQMGDKVFVLFGGPTPYLLRSKGENHRLIGPCYMHDLMDGQAIDGWQVGKYKTEKITLE